MKLKTRNEADQMQSSFESCLTTEMRLKPGMRLTVEKEADRARSRFESRFAIDNKFGNRE